jgi:hypothetical protein
MGEVTPADVKALIKKFEDYAAQALVEAHGNLATPAWGACMAWKAAAKMLDTPIRDSRISNSDVKALEALRDEMRQWLDPNGWVVDGDQPDVMVGRWADDLNAIIQGAKK